MKIKLLNQDDFNRMLLKKGYTKRSFGKALGITQSYAVHITNGKRHPSPNIAKKITDLLEEEFDHIFFIENVSISKQ